MHKHKNILMLSSVLLMSMVAQQTIQADERTTQFNNQSNDVYTLDENNELHSEEILDKNSESDSKFGIDQLENDIESKDLLEDAELINELKDSSVAVSNEVEKDLSTTSENITLKARSVSELDSLSQNNEQGISLNYGINIAHGNYSIDTLPYGVDGFERIGDTSQYVGQSVQVIRESTDGYYAEVQSLDGTYIGWVDKRSFDRQRVQTYEAAIIFGQYSIDTKPWGEQGYQSVGKTLNYVNQVVDIVAENKSGSYKLAVLNGEELGWIDHRALGRMDATTVARIGRGSYSVDTQPWGMTGFQTIDRSDDLLGQQVKVVDQQQNKHYSYVLVNDQPYGWVDNRALISDQAVYTSWLIHPNYRIDNAPWGERGFKQRSTSTEYVNQQVRVLGVNSSKTYYLIGDQKGQTLGWVDHRALSNVNYQAQIIRGNNFSIDSRPWTDRTGHRLGMTRDHLYQNVQVIGVTSNKSYLMVLMDNQPLGWIDYRALSREHGLPVQIRGGRYSIDTKPWGTSGYQQQTTAQNLQGKIVEILGETPDQLYQLIQYNNGEMGWIDHRALGYPVVHKPLSAVNRQVFNNLKSQYDYKNQTLHQIIRDYLVRKGIPSHNLTLSYVNLVTDQQFDWNGRNLIYGASTYKLPLAMVLTDLISENKLSYNQLVPINPQDIIYGGEGYWIGQRVPLGQLMEQSIVNSNNTASFALMTYLRNHFGQINEMNKRYSKEPVSVTGLTEGSTTSRYQADVLRSLYRNETKYSKIIKDLKRATPGQYMQRYIPNEVAHKYGQLYQYWSSTGITYARTPFAAAIYTQHVPNAERVIGELNAVLYHYTEANPLGKPTKM